MMLVDQAFRSRGIGRVLMTHALEALDAAGADTVRLDATPLGRPLYDSLGFTSDATLARHLGVLEPVDGPASLHVTPVPDIFDRMAELDRDVTGTDRGRLLRRLVEEHPESVQVAIESGDVRGFLLSRPGSRARRIGPCIARDHAGPRLFGGLGRTYAGETVAIDIPTDNVPAMALARSWGLKITGTLTRMSRGRPITEDAARLWASSGPEKG
jgi:hypothetical protein